MWHPGVEMRAARLKRLLLPSAAEAQTILAFVLSAVGGVTLARYIWLAASDIPWLLVYDSVLERVRGSTPVCRSALTAVQLSNISSTIHHVGFGVYSSIVCASNTITDVLHDIAAALLRYVRMKALEALGIPADILDRVPHT